MQETLIAILAILVIVLAALLWVRISREKKGIRLIDRMDLREFSEFLNANSISGTIQVVARKVSDLLQDVFECEKIIFLRKQRSNLELNYYHNLGQFNRQDFRLNFTDDLADVLKRTFLPRTIQNLKRILPEDYYRKLENLNIDVYFPVFWRDNLYGLYFIKSNLETKSPSFFLFLGTLAQSLAAAYHIKWHESRYNKLEQRISDARNMSSSETRLSSTMTPLIRHRNATTIIPKILEALVQEMELKPCLCFYESKNRLTPVEIYKSGLHLPVKTPDKELMYRLVNYLDNADGFDLDRVAAEFNGNFQDSLMSMVQAGIKYVFPFRFSPDRLGLIFCGVGFSVEQCLQKLLGYQEQSSFLVENAETYEKVEALSYTDNLTGLANQRYFHKRLKEEIDRAKRYHRNLALIIFDLDDLKKINDRYGHLAGDATLHRLGQILRSSIRTIDIIARYGGDEFCVIMPEADSNTCEQFMNRLSHKISSMPFEISQANNTIKCTVSLGGAIFPDHADTSEKLIFNADMALLKAKEAGRNTFRLFSSETIPS